MRCHYCNQFEGKGYVRGQLACEFCFAALTRSTRNRKNKKRLALSSKIPRKIEVSPCFSSHPIGETLFHNDYLDRKREGGNLNE